MVKNFAVIIECPVCHSRFEAALLEFTQGGRQVRCSDCEHTWRISKKEALLRQTVLNDIQTSDELDEKLEHIPETDDILLEEASDEDSDESLEGEFGGHRSWVAKSFLLLFAIIAFLCVGLYYGRSWVVQVIPELQTIYTQVGISTISSDHLKLVNTSWARTVYRGNPSILIRGLVVNTSDKIRFIPDIQVKLKGSGVCEAPHWMDNLLGLRKKSCSMLEWPITPSKDKILPGEKIEFSSVYPYSNPEKVKSVLMNFIAR